MSEVTRILSKIEQGDQQAAEELLPLIYDELRQLAARLLSHEKPGQTLQPTALVHEAYMRLVGSSGESDWDNQRHFFAAASEAMRRILVENARRKQRVKHGGDHQRVDYQEHSLVADIPSEDVLALDEALSRLTEVQPAKAELVKLRCFGGLTLEQAAEVLDISRATASRHWSYARAWLYDRANEAATES